MPEHLTNYHGKHIHTVRAGSAPHTVVLLAGALGIGLLLARLLRLALGNLLLPAVLAGALTGFFAACGSL